MVSSWKAERDSLRDDLYPYITVSGVEMEAEPLGKGPIQWQDNIDYSWEDPNWPDPSDDGGGRLVALMLWPMRKSIVMNLFYFLNQILVLKLSPKELAQHNHMF